MASAPLVRGLQRASHEQAGLAARPGGRLQEVVTPEKAELHEARARVLRNAHLILPDRTVDGDLVVRGTKIAALAAPGSARGDEIWDLEGIEVAPGAIDSHTHGGWGTDFARASAAEIAGTAPEYARAGVTRALITVYPAPEGELLAILAEAARACELSDAFLGIHLEGPFLSRDRRGALPEAGVYPFDARLHERLRAAAGGMMRVMTFAPEAVPAAELKKIQSQGIALSIGHTSATAGETEAALREGVTRATHLCNAMQPVHHRRPGPVLPLLLDRRARVEVIVDGEHLDDRMLEMILILKGDAAVIAVSDSMPLAGLGPATGEFCGRPAVSDGKRATIDGGTLAGSVLPLGAALARAGAALGLARERLCTLGAATPAADLRLPYFGRIATGYCADLVLRGADGRVVAALRAGKRADDPAGAFLPPSIRRVE